MTAAKPSPTFVLVPSPLVGPYSWAPVADELATLGRQAIVTVDLRDPPGSQPVWWATVGGAQSSLRSLPGDRHVVLVAHSRAGPLLPAIGATLLQPVDAYLFVDSRLPHGGSSPLQALEEENAVAAADRRARLETGERYPVWTDEDLRELIPDPERRRKLLAELRPRGLDFWTEPLPVVSGWPNAPCGYLLFSAEYRSAFERARRWGWLSRELPAGHFHQLVDPSVVAVELTRMLASIGNASRH